MKKAEELVFGFLFQSLILTFLGEINSYSLSGILAYIERPQGREKPIFLPIIILDWPYSTQITSRRYWR